MATAATLSHITTHFKAPPIARHHRHSPNRPPAVGYPYLTAHFCKPALSFSSSPKLILLHSPPRPSFVPFSGDGGDGGDGGGGGGGGGGGDGDSDGDAWKRNKAEAIMALAEAGRSLDSIPKDLASAIEAGRIPGSIIRRFFELENAPVIGWLLHF